MGWKIIHDAFCEPLSGSALYDQRTTVGGAELRLLSPIPFDMLAGNWQDDAGGCVGLPWWAAL
ncbi:hypothetical protein CA85_29160 [Allorhodopirellula solitaria]|uniref:Uncharacterized protein n=1 Tax=Allorhodopirellula solitaria TaxID=2527987 RepID=A0A5C5XT60_9BACT|nr:hypothetical protein CA85_29160 [Allorhodopirellula solitaria]